MIEALHLLLNVAQWVFGKRIAIAIANANVMIGMVRIDMLIEFAKNPGVLSQVLVPQGWMLHFPLFINCPLLTLPCIHTNKRDQDCGVVYLFVERKSVLSWQSAN